MKVLNINALIGPNLFAYYPVIEMELDLAEYDRLESKNIKGFNSRLLKLLPGLYEHHCSLGSPGGFVQRLKEGTYFSHIIEHVALELQTLVGHKVFYGKTK